MRDDWEIGHRADRLRGGARRNACLVVQICPVMLDAPFFICPLFGGLYAIVSLPPLAQGLARLHTDRAAGGDRDHCDPHWLAPASGPEGPRGRRSDEVLQQPQ